MINSFIAAKIKPNWRIILLLFFICLMFYPYSYLSWQTDQKFYSPDETANFVFAKQFIEQNRLSFDEPLNRISHNVILPRSVNAIDGKLVPQSFPGMILFYGLLGKIIGLNAVTFISPILALLCVLILYWLMKVIFDKNIAFWSALVLLFLPPFWFNSGKSMLHNTTFIFFLLLGLLLLYQFANQKKVIYSALGCFSLGLSLFIRTAELIPIAITLVIFMVLFRKRFNWKALIINFLCFCLPLAGLLALNYWVYSHFFSLGYFSFDQTSTGANQNTVSQIIDLIRTVLLPFGLNIKNILFQSFEFFLKYLWYIFIPFLVVIIYFIKNWRELSLEKKSYSLITMLITISLVISYGSFWPWGKSGLPVEPTFFIGSPHLRYWLPIFILIIPYAAIFWTDMLAKIFPLKKSLTVALSIAIVALIAVCSWQQVFYDPDEGYLKIELDISEFSPRLQNVNNYIPAGSIIVVPEWADRIFFPEFRVVTGMENPQLHKYDAIADIALLLDYAPIYYYTASSEKDLQILTTSKLAAKQSSLEKIADIYKGERLYRFVKTN